jgi:hypothetical protein
VDGAEERVASSRQETAAALRAQRDAQSQEATARQEVAFLRQTLAQKNVEVRAASDDLMLMTRENQVL